MVQAVKLCREAWRKFENNRFRRKRQNYLENIIYDYSKGYSPDESFPTDQENSQEDQIQDSEIASPDDSISMELPAMSIDETQSGCCDRIVIVNGFKMLVDVRSARLRGDRPNGRDTNSCFSSIKQKASQGPFVSLDEGHQSDGATLWPTPSVTSHGRAGRLKISNFAGTECKTDGTAAVTAFNCIGTRKQGTIGLHLKCPMAYSLQV